MSSVPAISKRDCITSLACIYIVFRIKEVKQKETHQEVIHISSEKLDFALS